MIVTPPALIPSPDDSEHDRLYKKAVVMVWPYVSRSQIASRRPGFLLARKLKKGVLLLSRVIRLNPQNSPAMWIAGLACRRLGDLKTAMRLFTAAANICHDNPDLPRDAGLTALELGKPGEAIRYITQAVKLRPDDASLIANLALAHLFNQEPAEAKRAADYAAHIDPKDQMISRICQFIDSVVAGKRPCPKSPRELVQR